MSDRRAVGVPWSFWAIGAIALLWNGMGCVNFVMQMNAEVLASYSETARSLVEDRPGWATAAFAVSQFGGVLGCLLLLIRRSAAYSLFVVSLLGIVVTVIQTLRMAATTIELKPAEVGGYVVMPLAVALFLVWYSKRAESKGWTR